MNMAARIETSGEKNRVHLSSATAALLRAEGLEHWLLEREEKVSLKGKGNDITTFWLKQGAIASSIVSSVCSSTDASIVQQHFQNHPHHHPHHDKESSLAHHPHHPHRSTMVDDDEDMHAPPLGMETRVNETRTTPTTSSSSSTTEILEHGDWTTSQEQSGSSSSSGIHNLHDAPEDEVNRDEGVEAIASSSSHDPNNHDQPDDCKSPFEC
jgi:hypothetical protein